MKFSRLDFSILRSIHDAFPIPFVASPKSVIAVGERPLLTEELLCKKLLKASPESVCSSLARLIAFQCIEKVYLYSQNEFAEQWAAGRTIRHVVLTPPSGLNCFQVTQHGIETLEKCFRERVKRTTAHWISKLLEEYVPLLIAFGLGMLLSSLFGFDLKQLRQ